MNTCEFCRLSDEVSRALADNRPVVALESTIIAHGMPYPQNIETALQVEQAVRDQGAVPATIAVLGGKPIVGLTAEEIDYLGRRGRQVSKVSRRDLPLIVAARADGATTVAGTMIIAALAGIPVFATGGIGGVHRGGEKTFDISADLTELARTSVAVVCAGAKSVLDLPLTLEYLETQGVPVIGYQTDELPAFYTRSSGLNLGCRAETPEQLAEIIACKWRLGLSGGIVIANPVPEQYSLDPDLINRAIDSALAEAAAAGVAGKELTPFLLARIKDITAGQSLTANIQLVLNNARLAARVSAALADLDGRK
ncbi:MAG: pseudouridine-5'-phosphate glycosidase [Negativicutes bacterium]|nr:pseudouridine-5'-phosphate glycosidase [Negativicutes bacterium]